MERIAARTIFLGLVGICLVAHQGDVRQALVAEEIGGMTPKEQFLIIGPFTLAEICEKGNGTFAEDYADKGGPAAADTLKALSTCKLFVAFAGVSSPQTSSMSRSVRTGRPPAVASAASSACERSPATGAPCQRTSPSSVKATVTGQV